MRNPPPGHWLDRAFSRYNRGNGLFVDGWGDWQAQHAIGQAATDIEVIDRLSVTLSPGAKVRGGFRLYTGIFQSPLGDALPPRTRSARFWWLRPRKGDHEPVWLHMAGTGESGANRRLSVARPLARHGISSIVLENPYYGDRAPEGQVGNDLRTVADLVAMGRAAVREARALMGWLGDKGHTQRGISGYSMGGHIAALTAATFPEPIACAPLAAGLSAVPVFCHDTLSQSVRWDVLSQGVAEPRRRMATLVGLSDIDRFSPPVAPKATVLLGARSDAYVRSQQVKALHAHWAGSDLRWFSGGHVSAYIRRKVLVDALLGAIERL